MLYNSVYCTVEKQIEKQFYLKKFLQYLGTHEMASCTCSSLVAKWGLK
jgi:hypothetical protein